jgi:ankyrin repeat protein
MIARHPPSPLFRAVRSGNPERVQNLILNGADPLVYDRSRGRSFNITPYHLSVAHRNETMIKLFLETHLIDPNIAVKTASPLRPTPFCLAYYGLPDEKCSKNREALVKTFKALIENRADTQNFSPFGLLPIHLAAMEGLVEIAKMLPQDLSKPTRSRGDTPLHLAVKHHREDMVEYLLSQEADQNKRNYFGLTPRDITDPYCSKAIKDKFIIS